MLHTNAIVTVYHLVSPHIAPVRKSGRELMIEVALEEGAWVVLHIVIPIIVSILVGLGFDGAYHLPLEGASVARESASSASAETSHSTADSASSARTQNADLAQSANVRTVYIVVEKGSTEWNTLVSQVADLPAQSFSHPY
jgi:hypothetical protein